MRNIPSFLLAVLLACALCAGCGAPAAPEAPPAAGQTGPVTDQTEPPADQTGPVTVLPEADHPDLTGVYTDKQGTADVYSELELALQADGTYKVTMGLYRITTLEGTAVWRDGTLHFTSKTPAVEADITVADGGAEVTVTASEQAYISPGDVYAFPDGAPDPAPRPESLPGAYRAVLTDLLEKGVFPGGEEAERFADSAPDQYAVFDVDGDGREELLIRHTDAPTAGMVEKVYDIDPGTGAVREQFSDFPGMSFYDNGALKVEMSHNQGRAGNVLWPYALWTYQAGTDSYEVVGIVDAWDKSLGETMGDDLAFPADVDQDGDGVVYYIMPYGGYWLEEEYAVDKARYDLWVDTYLGGAAALEIPFQDLTAESLEG